MRLFTYTASEQYCKRCKEKVLLFDCLSFRWRVSAKWAVCNIVRSLHGQVILLTELNSTNIAHICSLGKFSQTIQREVLDVIVHVWPVWQQVDFALSVKVFHFLVLPQRPTSFSSLHILDVAGP